MFKHIKKWIQRARKGYSYEDLWSLDYWFQTTFSNALLEFEKGIYGHPMNEKYEEIETFDANWVNEQYKIIIKELKEHTNFKDCKDDVDKMGIDDDFIRWKLILRRISYCLKESSDDCSEKNKYLDEWYDTFISKESEISDDKEKEELEEKMRERENEIDEYRLKMKDEAFDLIKKYFYSMWD